MVDSLEMKLQGYAQDQSPQTYLTTAIDDGELALTVNDGQQVSRGLVQVEDELLWVESVSNQAGTATVPPYGRGYMGSTATSHDVGVRVVDNPIFPRIEIRRTIAEVIGSLYPDLYALTAFEFDYNAAQMSYALPAGTVGVSSASWQTIGPSEVWEPIRRWRYDANADPDTFASGRTITIGAGNIVPGRTVRVMCLAEPQALASDADDFTETGLGSYVEPVVNYGVMYRMVGNLGGPRLQVRAVESSQRSAYVETGAPANLSKYFYALYQAELAKARTRFLTDNPTQIHKTRL